MNSRINPDIQERLHRFRSAPYGLASQLRSTWIDHFQVAPDDDVQYIWFGYSETPRPTSFPRQYVLCGTLYLDSTTGSLSLDSARLVTLILANLTLPKADVPRDSSFVKRLFRYVDDQAVQHERWAVASWQIDGMPAVARRWEFAGGAAAFAVHDSEKAALIITEGVTLDSLNINTMSDLEPYGIDATRGIRFSDLHRGPGTMAPARTTYHPDHEQFR